MTLPFYIEHRQSVGGSIRIYPACERSQEMADVIGCKVFTLAQLKSFTRMGFIVSVAERSELRRLETVPEEPMRRPERQAGQIRAIEVPRQEPVFLESQKRRALALWGR